MAKQKKNMSPAKFLLRTSPWVDFFCFLEVFAALAQKSTKTHGKQKK